MAGTTENRGASIFVIVLVFILMFLCFMAGKSTRQQEIEDRVWPIQKDCYNQQDLEIIIFGEIQE